ncbi:MAG: peptidoglycan editing factor PgeF [Acidobacteriia bacterium]|nr:peptidoglycan editing factor PgeF [Terriglobia bacterium]
MTTTLAKKRKAPQRRAATAPAPWKLRRAGRVQLLEAPPLERLDWLVHGFSTRPGSNSDLAKTRGHRKTSQRLLHPGSAAEDSSARVAENRKAFFHALGADHLRAVTLRQIHSDIVHRVDSPDTAAGDPPGGDALFTRAPGCLLVIQTADCVPILLADTKQRAIAAIHAGWRGTVRRIAAKTLGRMQMEFGTRPQDVVAALGPSIGRCCYEVGEDVAREFHAQFPQARQWFDGPFDALASGENDPNWLPWLTMMPPGHQPPPLRVHLDLIAANRAILAEAGVPPRQISSSGFCTACRTDLFFSYRREGKTGRLLAAIGIL